jgi:hypothetical protein
VKKYVVGRKCVAIEWVFVEADNETNARRKADANEDVSMASPRLEFTEYLNNQTFIVKELTSASRGSHSPIRGHATQNKPHNAEGEVIIENE